MNARTIPALVIAATALIVVHAQSPADRLHHLFAQYWEEILRDSPETATNVGRTEYNDRWTDCSPAGLARAHARRERYLSELSTFKPAGLEATDRLSLSLLRYLIERELES